MRPPRVLSVALALPAVLLGGTSCSGADDAPATRALPTTASAPSAPTTPAPPTPPTPAGESEATELTGLPAGPATGTAVLSYSGLGELRSPFTGDCAHTGGGTRVEGTADTARIRLEVTPDGARIVLDDVGFSATSTLTAGRYEVRGHHLTLAADLTQDGEHVGTAELEVDCGR